MNFATWDLDSKQCALDFKDDFLNRFIVIWVKHPQQNDLFDKSRRFLLRNLIVDAYL